MGNFLFREQLDADELFIKRHSSLVKMRGKNLSVLYIPHKQQQPLMVFVHGLGGQTVQFYHQIKYFSEKCSVLAFDFAGFGHSDPSSNPKDYETDSIVKDLVEIIRKYSKNSSKIILVGHSYGTRIAMLTSLQLELDAMILLSPKSKMTLKEINQAKTIIKLPNWIVYLLRLLDRMGGIYSKSVNRMLGPTASIELREKQLKWNKFSSTASIKLLLKGMDQLDESTIKLIKTPTLIISGKNDKVTPFESNTYEIHQWISANSLTEMHLIEDAGHNLMYEKPLQVNQLVENFIKMLHFV